jgi:hypothetical protein
MDSRNLQTSMLTAILAACSVCFAAAPEPPAPATGAARFSFSSDVDKDRAEAANRAGTVQRLVSAPCQRRLKNRRILLLIGERTPDEWLTNQDRYGPMIRVIESRLKALGLQPYAQEQIKAQIAQAEVDAYFKNDPDAALAASKRLGTDYVLRGSISSRAGVNAVVRVDEVAVSIDLTLSTAGGDVLSEVSGHSDSYSDTDTLRTALALMQEQTDPLVAQLYNDYCRKRTSR